MPDSSVSEPFLQTGTCVSSKPLTNILTKTDAGQTCAAARSSHRKLSMAIQDKAFQRSVRPLRGHTTEILRLLSCLSESYSPRHYIFADSDKMSEAKIRSFEQKRSETFSNSQFTLDRIPRSREVRQSWTSSVVTTLYSILYSLPLTYKLKPDLILCNGPGTCVPVCISALLLGLLGIKRAIIVYVESICRVETLSLSGKILYYFSDYFIVQWPDLKEKYPKSVYLGRIV
ncbi:PREDICTED: UDP-N-acetylglucosamine transferase subunit ALG14 homolog [Pygoscelis adeliae]|uniref:UDP-N-acetylglucosamine transferase subunit ALG14 homolog n=1 Tax=Pygoscelis adeliae TaxID=9238 RepID=UPI0004F50143|nr:PREDICTED: UDP-N-acetylglucosamine transferase subunit ALG14 homolog [Pygoscelis adeliae]